MPPQTTFIVCIASFYSKKCLSVLLTFFTYLEKGSPVADSILKLSARI